MKRLFFCQLVCLSLLPAQKPERVVALEGETLHVQGIAVVDGRFLVTSVDRTAREGWLMEFDGAGKRVREVKIHDGAMYHPGGFDVDGESLWIPVAEYRPKSRSVIQRRSAAGFELISSFAVPDHIGAGKRVREVKIHDGAMYHPGGFDVDGESLWIPVAEYRPKSSSVIQRRSAAGFELISSFAVPDHIGAVAAGSDRLFLANWDARKIYEYGFDGKLIRERANPTAYRFQDLKMRYGVLVGSAPAGKGEAGGGAVVWMDPETLGVTGVRRVGRTDRGVPLVQEGIELRDGRVYLLPEDTPSRVFVYDLIGFTAGN